MVRMMSPDRIVAGLTALVCLVFLVRLALGPARQQRFDAVWRRLGHRIRHLAHQVRHWGAHRRQRQQVRDKAAKTAQEAIDRARRGAVQRDGNVIRPSAFKSKDEEG